MYHVTRIFPCHHPRISNKHHWHPSARNISRPQRSARNTRWRWVKRRCLQKNAERWWKFAKRWWYLRARHLPHLQWRHSSPWIASMRSRAQRLRLGLISNLAAPRESLRRGNEKIRSSLWLSSRSTIVSISPLSLDLASSNFHLDLVHKNGL